MFGAVLDLPHEQRSAFLDEACRDTPDVRRLVDELLLEAERAAGFLSKPLFSPASDTASAATHSPISLRLGARLGRYSVIEALGSGGMGVVYRARDERLERAVAIKILAPSMVMGDGARRRFRREALALAKLSHPNIAAIYDVGEHDNVDFIVMECVPGESLASKLKSGSLSVKDTTSIALQIAEALEEAHEHGIVHRDLKPANVMVTPKGQVKVLDFGIAKILTFTATDTTQSNSETNGIIGTVAYMSPEQACGKELDARSDLFSFGAVLYELVTGTMAFRGESIAVVFKAILDGTPTSAIRLNPDLPPDLERIIGKALEKDRILRYQSATEICTDLQRLKRDMESQRISPATSVFEGGTSKDRSAHRLVASREMIGGSEIPTERRRIRIAMVPIEHLGGSAEDYFAAGLTDDMISALSRIDPAKLRVTTGPRLLPSQPLDKQLKRLQRELDLDYLLRATVRRSAETIRISAQLHDLKDKSVLWSETYDRKSTDLLGVQEEVTRRVSQSLALELLPGSVAGTRKYAASSAAYDAFLKGRFFWNKMTSDGIRNSLTYFTDAIAIDPEFAPAYSGLANCYLQMGASRVGTMKPIDAVARARPLLQRAMDLDNAMAEAHCTLGLMKSWYDLDWAGAEWEFKEALRLDASHLTTLQWQSLYLGAMGRHDEAIASVTRAVESEPLSPIMHAYLGIARGHALQFEMGLRELKQSIELDSHSYRPHMFLGNMYFDMERYEDGFAEVKLARSMNPDNLECIAYIGFAMAKLGDRQGALDAHQELLRAAEGRTEPALLASFIYAGLGEDAEMFRSLWEAMQKKCAPLYLVPLTGVFRRYRSDPRYGDFLRAMGLPQLARV